MHFALEMMASALDLEGAAWGKHVHRPTMWSDEGVIRKKPSDSQLEGLKQLRNMKRSPSELTAHYLSQPAFSASGIGSGVSGRAASVSTASSSGNLPHVVAAVKAITDYTNDGLAQDRAKKQRTEPAATEEEMAAFVVAKKAAQLNKRRAAKKAKKASNAST